jgi:hypothetical protein
MTFNRNKVLMWSGASVAAVILVLAILIALLPFIARVSFENWAEEQGLSGSISKVEISLTDGQLRLSDLKLLDAGNKGLRAGQIFVQVHMRDLWHKRVTVEAVQINTLSIDASRNEAGELTIAGLKQQAAAATEKTGKSKEDAKARPWQIAIAPISLKAVQFCMDMAETVTHPAYAVCANLQSLTWQGVLKLFTGTATAAPVLSMHGDLKLAGFNVDDSLHARHLAQFESLGFEGIMLKDLADITVRQIAVTGFRSLQRKTGVANDFLLSWQQLGLSGLTMQGEGIHLAGVSLEGLDASLRRDGEGNIELQQYLAAYRPKPQQTVTQDGKAQPLVVEKLVLSGASKLNFVDEAATPVVKQSFKDIALTIDKIDTGQPGQLSSFTLATQIGQFGQFDASGNTTLFAKRPTINAKGKILALNIGDLSAYAREFLQHKIKSGQLDADLDIKIEQGNIDSETKLTLHKFYVEPLKVEEKDPYKEDLGVTLTTALSLLREKDDHIAITLPVTGDINAPDFDLKDIINKVMVKAIKTTVLTYYSPFGLISLAKGAINLATALRFKPVAFAPNSSQLEARGMEKLQTISKLLNERPGVHLVLCGYASMADQLVLFPPAPVEEPDATESAERPDSKLQQPALTAQQREALVSLAMRRGEAVKHYLVNELGIGAERLILCNPEYVENDKQTPRVEISI